MYPYKPFLHFFFINTELYTIGRLPSSGSPLGETEFWEWERKKNSLEITGLFVGGKGQVGAREGSLDRGQHRSTGVLRSGREIQEQLYFEILLWHWLLSFWISQVKKENSFFFLFFKARSKIYSTTCFLWHTIWNSSTFVLTNRWHWGKRGMVAIHPFVAQCEVLDKQPY